MFSYICGRPVDFGDNSLVIDNNGMGWHLFATPYTVSRCRGRDQVQLYVHMSVREDDVSLYGFHSSDERDMFLMLNSISGVGAKTALGILSGIEHTEVVKAVAAQDIRLLSSVKGVGKKTAERIVLELKDKIGVSVADAVFAPAGTYGTDAVEALVGLGMSRTEAQTALARVKNADNMTTEQLVRAALKGM